MFLESPYLIKKMYPYKWPKGASKVGYLSVDQVEERLQVKEDISFVSGKFCVQYSVAMQRGYYREFGLAYDV